MNYFILQRTILFQEVTLRKCSSDEKLGLTVCYSSGSEVDTCTEVYIRDIAPQSVADRDGRLRQGDQILQVFTCLTPIRSKHVNKMCYFNNTSRKLS